MGKKTVRGHDIANRFVYSLKRGLYAPSFQVSSLNYKKFRTVPGLLEGNPQR